VVFVLQLEDQGPFLPLPWGEALPVFDPKFATLITIYTVCVNIGNIGNA